MLLGYHLLLYLIYINITLHFIHCTNDKVQIYYETNIPGTNINNLKKCVMDNVEFARAVRFDVQSETCMKMDADWNTNRTFIGGYIYAWITSYERSFTEAFSVISSLPENFAIGCKIDVIFMTLGSQSNWFSINIQTLDGSVVCLHIDIRQSWNTYVFNSRYGNAWNGEERVPNTVTSPNTVYTARIYLLSSMWTVYVNDDFIHNYTHQFSTSSIEAVVFKAVDVYCQRIVYYGP